MKNLAGMSGPEFAERLDRGEASLPRRFGIIDVAHRHFDGDIRPLTEGGDLDYRNAPLPRGRESKRRVRRDRRRNENGSTPAGGFEKSMQPPHGHGLRIESNEPRKR
ncbi:MAG TPA: hypothetical protein VNE19_03955, partial [Methylomirabilota bacterium]|nr:hypothetical protein [Methylomirabilota bacterium]